MIDYDLLVNRLSSPIAVFERSHAMNIQYGQSLCTEAASAIRELREEIVGLQRVTDSDRLVFPTGVAGVPVLRKHQDGKEETVVAILEERDKLRANYDRLLVEYDRQVRDTEELVAGLYDIADALEVKS